jgi:hypothetical protein
VKALFFIYRWLVISSHGRGRRRERERKGRRKGGRMRKGGEGERIHFFVCLFVFGGTGVLNSGFHICQAGALQLEPHLQSILLWLFFLEKGLVNYLPRLASTMILLISVSHIARITGMNHRHLANY